MARTNDINSATSQFFVNLVTTTSSTTSRGSFGYAVFGQVDRGHGRGGPDRGGEDRHARAATTTCRPRACRSSRHAGFSLQLSTPPAWSNVAAALRLVGWIARLLWIVLQRWAHVLGAFAGSTRRLPPS